MAQQVTAQQLSRLACLYVRQSTLQQVLEHGESTARQYALRERAVALWEAMRVAIEAITQEDAIAWFAHVGYTLPAQPI